MSDEVIKINNRALRILRDHNGMTQGDLAIKMGFDQSYISKLENIDNERGISFDFFIKLCRVFKKSPNNMCDILGIKIH